MEGGCVDNALGLIDGLKEMKEKRNPDAKLLFSFGGWTMSSAFTHCAKAGKREVWAKTAVDLMQQYGFDGVDVDWEYAGGGGLESNDFDVENDAQNYVELLSAIRAEFNARGLSDALLTIAVGAGPDKVDYLGDKGFYQQINSIVDYVNVMTYDFNGQFNPYTAHNAPLYNGYVDRWDAHSAMHGIHDFGMDKQRLVMGVPLYGRDWTGVTVDSSCDETGKNCPAATKNACGDWDSGLMDFTGVQLEFLEADGKTGKNGFTRYWDDSAKVPYLFNQHTGDFISYDDAESVLIKAEYAREQGFAGTMVWDITNDRASTLIDILHQESLKYPCRSAQRNVLV
jgi:chitinase